MRAKLQISRIEDCCEWMETVAADYSSAQSIGWYIDHIGAMLKTFAFINTQVAVAKMELDEAKKSAYQTMMLSGKKNGLELSPMLTKDYVASVISEQQYNWSICDRARSTCDTTIEALRSLLSALKEELKTMNYQTGNT